MKKERANKSREIVEAAYSVILEVGYCNASTQRIARRAGVTKSMLHYYFENKEAIMLETNKYAIEKMITVVAEAAERYSGDLSRLDKRFTLFWETIKENIDLMVVLYATSINAMTEEETRKKFSEFYGMILSAVTQRITNDYSDLNPSAKDAEAIASIVIGTMESLLHHYMVNPEITDFDHSVKMLIRLIQYAVPLALQEELKSDNP